MAIYRDSVKKVYSELEDTIILGLTGRTGSGCSTVSKILNVNEFEKLTLPEPKHSKFENLEERKYGVIHNFIKNNWEPFITIEVSSVIMSFVLEKSFRSFTEFIKKIPESNENIRFRIGGKDEFLKRVSGMKSLFGNREYAEIDGNIESIISDEKLVKKYYVFYTDIIKRYKESFRAILKDYSCYESSSSHFYNSGERKSHLYTYVMQLIGNNIRCSGHPYISKFDGTKFYTLSQRIRNIIKIIQRYNENTVKAENRKTKANNPVKTRICIDALRNPYEIFYLKDILPRFYLLSVSTEDSERKRRLSYLDARELSSLDLIEYPAKDQEEGEIFFQQSISDCLQISDIHIYNPIVHDNKFQYLTMNLVKYVSLMLHPGLVTPTDEERCMQIAYNTKFNSGCLSRQVGAVITDDNFCIKAVGWNDVPHGQIPCSLRSISNYISEADRETFSEFELTDNVFESVVEKLNETYQNVCHANECNLTFCFKDVYNGIKKDKNQVHTRALHAEENAFLQISKYGGQGIKGGKLFVTASPCELCSKKSYQLGIREIYYIDPYPGISASHILKSGEIKNNPELKLFYGAIGDAYIHLYTQRFSCKDELQLLTGVNAKKISSVIDNFNGNLEYGDVKYHFDDVELVFFDRHKIEFKQHDSMTFIKDGISQIHKKMTWSGSSYDKTVLDEETEEYTVRDDFYADGVHHCTISKNDGVFKSGDKFEYKIKTILRDESEIMKPVLFHRIKAKTEKLSMNIRFDKRGFKKTDISDVHVVIYADSKKNIVYKEEKVQMVENGDYYEYRYETCDPYLLYVYSIEWKFK